jgi:hypothetical protein
MNMKIRIIPAILLICIIFFLHACATSQKVNMKAVASRDQKVGSDEVLTSQKKHFVSLSPYTDIKVASEKTIFMLTVKNCGKKAIDISCGNIAVFFEENGKKGSEKRIGLQSLEAFTKDLKEEYNDYEKKYIKGKLEDLKLDSESSSSVTSDSDNMGDKVQQLKTKIETMRAQNQVIRETLPEFFLRSQTLTPDNSYNGIIVCDPSTMDNKLQGNFLVSVSVDGEVHKFVFKKI